jgi:hypothetical protein
MNLFLIFTIAAVFFSFCTAGLIFRDKHIGYIAVMGIIFFFSSYVVGTFVLFALDAYTLFRGIAVTSIIDVIILLIAAWFGRKRKFSGFDFDIKKIIIPLLATVVVIPLTSNKNELFGMGQDEGVYQTVAINFLNGITDRQQDFEEYHLLDSDESRENFVEKVTGRLVGYDIKPDEYPDTVYDTSVSEVSGIYHGIPTYAALLALWGELFGMENMADIQTVFCILLIFLVSFACRNLGVKTLSEAAACSLTAVSPIVIWVATSTLTEMFLADLMMLYLVFLTESERKEIQIFSIVPIAVFGCFHVSFFTILPMFILIYGIMYLFTRRKCFAVLMPVTAVGYIVSFFMMRQIQPFYTLNNYRNLFVGPFNVYNVSTAVVILAVVLAAASAVWIFIVSKIKNDFDLNEMMKVRKNAYIIRTVMAVILFLPVAIIILKAVSGDTEFGNLTIVGFMANAGIVLLPIAFIAAVVKPDVFTVSYQRTIVFLLFFYCVLVYSTFLRYEIDYYYYYARYLVPFIPYAVIFSVIAIESIEKRCIAVTVASVISILYTAPYTSYVSQTKDDTRLEWETLYDISEHILPGDCIVFEPSTMPTAFLPIRAMTGAAVYPAEDDIEEQLWKLEKQYDNVYYLTKNETSADADSNLEIIYTDTIHRSEDYYKGDIYMMDYEYPYEKEIIPMSKYFLNETCSVSLYRYMSCDTEYTADEIENRTISGFNDAETSLCWTNSEQASIRCTLEKNDYELELNFGCTFPIGITGTNTVVVKLYVNGVYADRDIITADNKDTGLTFDIPEEYLEDGANIITFVSPVWSASLVSDSDDRTLGIPIGTLIFK